MHQFDIIPLDLCAFHGNMAKADALMRTAGSQNWILLDNIEI